jgi:hypothetical protein
MDTLDQLRICAGLRVNELAEFYRNSLAAFPPLSEAMGLHTVR